MCFLGKIGDHKGQNTNIFLKSREENGLKCGRLACLLACPLVQAFEGSGPAGGWLWSSCRVFRCFCPLSRFALGALPLNMALFRVLRGFLEGFGVFVWVCIGSVLCVACGAFVCVRG